MGPYASGHLGDLPAIYVAADGTATTPVLAPRLKTIDQVIDMEEGAEIRGTVISDVKPKRRGRPRVNKETIL